MGDLEVRAIVANYGHFDHVLAVPYLRKKWDVPFMMNSLDMEILRLFGSYYPIGDTAPDVDLGEGDIIRVGNVDIVVIHTPGHTPGSICLYLKEDKILFTGDTLFKGAYGRTDLPGGDPEQMFDSLRKIFGMFPTDYRVFPGHGEETVLGVEKKYYIYLLD